MRHTRIATALGVAVMALTAALVSATPAAAAPTTSATAPTTSGAISVEEAYQRHHAGGDDVSTQACYLVYFYNNFNGKIVSAELNYPGSSYGMLRARATTVGPFEQFILRCPSSGQCYIYSLANGGYVSAELNYTGGNYAMLRARSTAWGPWENFDYVVV